MLTDFGKILRKIRIDHGEVLRDMAENLNSATLKMSSAYLSAVELGKRSIPNNMIAVLQEKYNLSDETILQLQVAANNSTKSVKIDLLGHGEDARNAALVFARNFESMDKKTAQKLLELFNKGG